MTDKGLGSDMPELPEPAREGRIRVGDTAPDYWSQDQMHAFYAAGVKAGMERAAQVAGGLDCAHICGVGHEVAAAIRKESSNG